ncbi:hypothetical protein Pth03_06050 [Planotetraspora thailandica]|uniref:YbaK/aminoacyl-tRNA synthetase-associated domain-containing protein n=1 Tax=Planotetraspora thailandica TaxID=487172 RepID=A0A8J3UZB6_9ACTN|nr:YbaK/EbsC family protein [Planotetraspora thailandica]GII52216.1 hypothetical protein Pth03_06050 [Planotetraspora thailandica]
MKDALAIHRWLLAHQIHHEIVRLPRPLTSSDNLPEILAASPETCVAVSVFVVSGKTGTEAVAVVGSVGDPPGAKAVGAFLGAERIRPATAFTVNSETDYADGLVCPLLLPDHMTVLIDQRLIDRIDPDDAVHTATGERCTALRLRAFHLFQLMSGKPVDLTTPRTLGLASLASPMSTA